MRGEPPYFVAVVLQHTPRPSPARITVDQSEYSSPVTKEHLYDYL